MPSDRARCDIGCAFHNEIHDRQRNRYSGCVVDSGKFDWSASGRYPSLADPEPAYHGLRFHETFGPLAFTFHSIAIGLRDLGMTMNPQGAHYTLMGLETPCGWNAMCKTQCASQHGLRDMMRLIMSPMLVEIIAL